jgi:hypothetical protein
MDEKKYPVIAELVKTWEEAQTAIKARSKNISEEKRISSDEFPPYFMTLGEAVKFLNHIGFRVLAQDNKPIYEIIINYWEQELQEHSGG